MRAHGESCLKQRTNAILTSSAFAREKNLSRSLRRENFLTRSSIIPARVAEEILIVLTRRRSRKWFRAIKRTYLLQEYSQEAVSHVHKYLMKNEVPVNLFEVGHCCCCCPCATRFLDRLNEDNTANAAEFYLAAASTDPIFSRYFSLLFTRAPYNDSDPNCSVR